MLLFERFELGDRRIIDGNVGCPARAGTVEWRGATWLYWRSLCTLRF